MPTVYQTWGLPENLSGSIAGDHFPDEFRDPLSRRILHRRLQEPGLRDWLQPQLADLLDPETLPGARTAATVLDRAASAGDTIAIFTDYDVDGITSATLATEILRILGAEVRPFVPDRLSEGYGLSRPALQRLLTDGKPDLLLVLDCGTTSEAELSWLRDQGIPSVVVDHHRRLDSPPLPDGVHLLNPHLPDRAAPAFQDHCTVGLVFKVFHALLRQREDLRTKIDLRRFLDLVAVGTVADLVSLRGENRLFVRYGLRELARTSRVGLRALLEASSLGDRTVLQPTDIGFRLGPRLNAGGRMESAREPLRLLLSREAPEARRIARFLNRLNEERRGTEDEVLTAALHQVGPEPPPGIVVADRGWHPGVVGIVASRLARRFHRPALVLGWDGTQWKGSGRSIRGINLMEVVADSTVAPAQWGGHPMAVGLSLGPDQVETFPQAFADAVDRYTGGQLPPLSLQVDALAAPGEISRESILGIESLGPYGMGHPEPVVLVPTVRLREPPALLKETHVRFGLPGTAGVEVIGWRMAAQSPPAATPLDLALRLERDWWRGEERLRGILLDWRPSEPIA
jgi:single-stranded-DNA-specific exonuclease